MAGRIMTTAYDFEFLGIRGAPLPLKQFEGKALLVVNVASRCGFTPQYSQLQKLYEDYSGRGLVVIGVPCNQFLWQEPRGEDEIATFCEVNYAISFPMTAKTNVKGPGAHPFFLWMSERLGRAAVPAWNFHKLLSDRSGAPVAAFKSAAEPDGRDFRAAVEQVL
jgi:glutathione peroxidase